MIADFFGRKNYGTAVGLMSTLGGIFSAIAPVIGGLIYDLYETYRISFAVGSLLVFIAIPIILSIKTENP
jgi:MFS family permease